MTESKEWLEQVNIDFHNWFEDRRANFCSERQWQAVEDLMDNKDHYWKGYKARALHGKAEIERHKNRNAQLEDFCQEFVYGEENPKYYKTMTEEITSLKSQLSEKEKLIEDNKSEINRWYREWYDLEVSSKKEIQKLKSLIAQARPWVVGCTALSEGESERMTAWIEKTASIVEEK
jgi:predicted RNase H-like nuclease (RuvC/YqgF family)